MPGSRPPTFPTAAEPEVTGAPECPAYRIEHRCGDAVAVVGYSDDPLARYTAMTRLAVRLIRAGATGAVELVEQGSGDVLARWALIPGSVPAAAVAAPEASEARSG